MTRHIGEHILTLAEASNASAVALSDVKDHLEVVETHRDALITHLIDVAAEVVEDELGRPVSLQTWNEALQYPGRDVYLQKLPAQSLVSITYYDTDNVEQTATLSEFTLYKSDDWAFVRCEDWPSTYDRPDAITIQYTAGHATTPKKAEQAIRLIVGHWYENREDASELNLKDIPRSASSLIGLMRSGWYG